MIACQLDPTLYNLLSHTGFIFLNATVFYFLLDLA